MHPQTFFLHFLSLLHFTSYHWILYIISRKEIRKRGITVCSVTSHRRPSKNIFFVMNMRCDHCVEYYPHIILLMLKLNLWLIKLTTKLPCIVFPCKSELLSYCNGEQPKTQNQAKKVSIMSHIFVVLSFWG